MRIAPRFAGALPLLGFTTAACAQGFDPNEIAAPDFTLTPFYEAGITFSGGHVGDLLKKETIPAPPGAVAWRVMYLSRTWDDRLVPVTGIIVAPKGGRTKRRAITAWAHGTTGAARVCAPSLAAHPAQDLVERSSTAPVDYGVPYLEDFLARGYVVVATDYYGLGGPGVHQYMVGSSAARNVMDIVRAAGKLKELNAGRAFITYGWSQGGHAAIFTGEEQPKYAPELRHLGVVGIAPAQTDPPRPVNVPHLYLIGARVPGCLLRPADGIHRRRPRDRRGGGPYLRHGVFKYSLERKQPFFADAWTPVMREALQANMPGNRRSPAPILVVQGTEDTRSLPEDTQKLIPRAAASGDSITITRYPGKNHRTVIDAAKTEILGWMRDRVSGKPIRGVGAGK